MTIKKLTVLVVVVMLGFVSYGYGLYFEKNFDAEPGITTLVKYDEGCIVFSFDMHADYHITDLKNKFFFIEVGANDYIALNNVAFPDPVSYGEAELVFKGKFNVTVYVKPLQEITAPQTLKFKVGYQVCQEKPVEQCYQFTSVDVDVKVEKSFKEAAPKTEAVQKSEPAAAVAGESKGTETVQKSETSGADDESYFQWVERTIKQELEKKSFYLFLLVFIAGFLTSLTPCVYPVIPIVMGYIGTRSAGKKLKGFYLSIFFVLGLATVYSVFGVIAATTGTMMGVSFQNPIVVIVIASIFIIMGLSLAGFFEIPVPSSISSKMQSGHKSEVMGALIVGGISGIIAAPCVGPVLIALLSWISQTGNILLGFWLTFTFSMGMGIIFLVVGTFSGAVSSMPKGGSWMSVIKYFFSVILLGGGIYFITTITEDWMTNVLWGAFLVAASVFMGLFKPQEEDDELGAKAFKVLLVFLFLIGAFLFVRGLDAKYFPAKYTAAVTQKEHLPWISDLEEGRKLAKQENKIMMMDTAADWCVACKELDEETFSAPEVAERLKKDFILVKLDFTLKNEANENLRKSLNVIGMPTVIFYNPDGSELKRFSGFKKKEPFLKFLDSLK
ncbi:MAG: thioredoxin fold domain-containing protein [bacterium]|nr:thioredoxin fold domain-containing protein [bacterium]